MLFSRFQLEIDLDLLLYYDDITGDPSHWRPLVRVDPEGLQLPHPRLCERDFTLRPLTELAPNLRLHRGRTPQQCLDALGPEQVTILGTVSAKS